MTQLEHSRVWQRPGTSEGDYAFETESVHFHAVRHFLRTDGENQSLQFVFTVAAGSGYSDLVLEVGMDDLPVLLANIAEMPGGTRVLAEAAAQGAAHLQDALTMVLEAAQAAIGAADSDHWSRASQPTGMRLQMVAPEQQAKPLKSV